MRIIFANSSKAHPESTSWGVFCGFSTCRNNSTPVTYYQYSGAGAQSACLSLVPILVVRFQGQSPGEGGGRCKKAFTTTDVKDSKRKSLRSLFSDWEDLMLSNVSLSYWAVNAKSWGGKQRPLPCDLQQELGTKYVSQLPGFDFLLPASLPRLLGMTLEILSRRLLRKGFPLIEVVLYFWGNLWAVRFECLLIENYSQ